MRKWIDLLEAPEDYDLKGRYAEFNRLYFDSELPDIPITFSPLKNLGGKVEAKTIGLRGRKEERLKPETLRMVISNTFKKDYGEIDKILLHEMIHVYVLAVLHKYSEHHGAVFLKKLREVSQKSGIEIPLTDRRKPEAEMSSAVAVKPLVVIIFESTGRSPSFCLLSPTSFENNRETFLSYCGRYANYLNYDVTGYLVTSPAWTRVSIDVPVQRAKIKTLNTVRDPALLTDLQQNGQVLFHLDATKRN